MNVHCLERLPLDPRLPEGLDLLANLERRLDRHRPSGSVARDLALERVETLDVGSSLREEDDPGEPGDEVKIREGL